MKNWLTYYWCWSVWHEATIRIDLLLPNYQESTSRQLDCFCLCQWRPPPLSRLKNPSCLLGLHGLECSSSYLLCYLHHRSSTFFHLLSCIPRFLVVSIWCHVVVFFYFYILFMDQLYKTKYRSIWRFTRLFRVYVFFCNVGYFFTRSKISISGWIYLSHIIS